MAEANQKSSPVLVVIAFAIVYVVWGSTYFFIQKAVHGFPPLLLGAIRFTAAGALLVAWSILRGEKVFEKKNIINAAISGVLLLFFGNGAVIWVEQYLPSAMVAIMVSSAPIWFVVLDKRKWAENFNSKTTIAGLIAGFTGVIILFSEKIFDSFAGGGRLQDLWGLGLLVIGSMAWAGGSLYSKYRATGGSSTVNTSWQMVAAGIAFLPGSLWRGEIQHLQWDSIPASAWASLLYLVFFGSIAGFSAYVWLLRVRSATQVSTHAYVNPVVAVLLGVFFANEHISFLQIFGLVIILGSVLMINAAKYRKDKTMTIPDNNPLPEPMSPKRLQKYTEIAAEPAEKYDA